jgi:hypothetical protein
MQRKQPSRSNFYVPVILFGLAGTLIGGLCSFSGLLTYEQGAEIQFAILSAGCLAIPGFSIVAGGVWAWYRDKIKKEYQSKVHALKTAKVRELEDIQRDRWLESLEKPSWGADACEVEMEAKFIFPLLKFLGYDERDMRMRIRTAVQEGRLDTTIEADWVLLEGKDHIAVIEAKAPRQSLNSRVVEQAKSYAIRLNAPVYIITNGYEIAVYHREVIGDRRVFRDRIERLHERWDELHAAASKKTVVDIHRRLKINLNRS